MAYFVNRILDKQGIKIFEAFRKFYKDANDIKRSGKFMSLVLK